MERSESLKELTAALAKAQIAFLAIKKTEKVDYQTTTGGRKKYNYAPLSEVIESTKKGLSDNGLAVMQLTKIVEAKLFVETILSHSSGEWIKSEMFVGDMTQTPQAEGSALTYKRRYSLSAMLNVASEEDDDAQEAESATNPKYTAGKPLQKPIESAQNKQGAALPASKVESTTEKVIVPGSDQWIISKVKELKIAEAPFLEYVNKTLHIPVEQTLGETVKKLNPQQRAEVASAINAKEKAKTV